jgi:hypothetical protein
MFTTGFKLYFGMGMLFLLAAILYGWTSGGVDWGLFPSHLGTFYFALLGALTLGWRGGVGDHVGYVVLVAGAAASFGVGAMVVAFRDSDARAVAEVAGTAAAPQVRTPYTPSLFAPIAALGVAMVVLGLVTTRILLWAGFIVIGLAALEWVVQAWADRATGDYRVNHALRNRVINPIEVPVVGVLIIGFVVFGVSRVLLTLPKMASVWVTIGAAALIFVVAIALAAAPRLAKPVLATVLLLSAIAILTGGVIGAGRGEREFHPHEPTPAPTTVPGQQIPGGATNKGTIPPPGEGPTTSPHGGG